MRPSAWAGPSPNSPTTCTAKPKPMPGSRAPTAPWWPLVVVGSRALVAHLGDSRAYLYREGQLTQLTRDHTLVQSLVDAQQVQAEDAGNLRVRNVVTRYMGMKPPARADSSAQDLSDGDRILLCSDGLHGVVDRATLTRILGKHDDPGEVCAALIAAARGAGAPDNVTALVVDVSDS